MNDIFDDMFEQLHAMFNTTAERPLTTYGLKQVIKRPHNLYRVKDEDGNVTSYKLDVVTTPFKKEDVKVSVENDVLTVKCGVYPPEQDNDDVFLVYRGISAQTYEFSLKLNHIDVSKISAKIEDGILHLEMPVIKEEKPKAIEIAIQ